MKELKKILSSIQLKLASYDKDAKRDKRRDYKLIPKTELNHILDSQVPVRDKKKILLSQIGLLRINLFMEFYERIQSLERESRLDEAVALMNDYALNVAIPFIPRKKTASLMSRFIDLIRLDRQLEPFEYVQEWKSKYQSWRERRKVPMNPRLRQEMFTQLRFTFNMLYTVSFSDENFPPSPTIVFFNPTRVMI